MGGAVLVGSALLLGSATPKRFILVRQRLALQFALANKFYKKLAFLVQVYYYIYRCFTSIHKFCIIFM